jgi:uncharacterized membrane protein YedE/YeeE
VALITAFVAGLVFGLGLVVAGMANPAKVLGFLDIAGKWDPSLLFVMVAPSQLAWWRLPSPVGERRVRSACPMQLPTARAIDARLVGGSLLFGIGWGLAGFCPGPAIVALGAGYGKAGAFIAAMLVGMAIVDLIDRARARA